METDFDIALKNSIGEIIRKNPSYSEDKAFVRWFVGAFITEEDVSGDDSIVGGANDKNIDAIYIDDEIRCVYVIQGKYRKNTSKLENRSDVIAFTQVAGLLHGSSNTFNTIVKNAEEGMRPLLKKARDAIKRNSYQLALQYASTARISEQNIEEADEIATDFSNTTFQIFDNSALRRLMQDYIHGAAPPIPQVKLLIEHGEAFDSHDKKTNISSWVFSMNGRDLGDLFNRHGVRIFARNIRGFLGYKSEINKGLVSTIENKPEMFWHYNNGVTIICDGAQEIKRQGKRHLTVSNAQIINGQQTTRTLADSKGSENVKVLVRVDVLSRSNDQDFNQYNQLVSEVVKATNSQNNIKPADLISNDAEQIRIERELRKLEYYYARKTMTKGEMRAHYGARNRQIIKRDDLVMAIASCTIDPSIVRKGKQQFFVQPYYEQLFGGRAIYEYLAMYWLYMFSKYKYRHRGPDVGYSRHVVNNHLWKMLKNEITTISRVENFIYLARSRRYDELSNLGVMIDKLIAEAIRCYKSNRKYQANDESGNIVVMKYAEIDYFKRASIVREWNDHWRNVASDRSKKQILNAKNRLLYDLTGWL